MKKYSDWQIKMVSVANLELSPENARLHYPVKGETEEELIRELCLYHNVEKLAKKMVKEGYNPEENLIVISDSSKKNKYIVLEGNRRTTVLKCLYSPKRAPEKKRDMFVRLLKSAGGKENIVKKVNCLIAKNIPDAMLLIRNKHTKDSGMESWSYYAQCRDYFIAYNLGSTIEEISEENKEPKGKILKNIRDYHFLHYCLSLRTEDDEPIIGEYDFPWTTLTDRFFNWKPFKNHLKISYEGEYGEKVYSGIVNDDLSRVIARICYDIDKKIINVDHEKIKDSGQREIYLKGIIGDECRECEKRPLNEILSTVKIIPTPSDASDEPGGAAPGGAVPGGAVPGGAAPGGTVPGGAAPGGAAPGGAAPGGTVPGGTAPGGTAPGGTAPGSRGVKKINHDYLIPKGFGITIQDHKVQEIVNELNKIKINDFPHAVAMLHRALLEISLIAWLRRKGVWESKVLDRGCFRKFKDGTKSPNLSDLLIQLCLPDFDLLSIDGTLRMTLHEFINVKEDPSCGLNQMNCCHHNIYKFPYPDEIRRHWKTLEGLYNIILNEPEK